MLEGRERGRSLGEFLGWVIKGCQPFKDMNKEKKERNDLIYRLHLEKVSYNKLAIRFKISPQMIYKIVKRYGIINQRPLKGKEN